MMGRENECTGAIDTAADEKAASNAGCGPEGI